MHVAASLTAALVLLSLACSRDVSLPEPRAVPALTIDSVTPLVATAGTTLTVEAHDLNGNTLTACSVHVGSASADCIAAASACTCSLLIDDAVPEGKPDVSVHATSAAGQSAASSPAPFYVDRLAPVIDASKLELVRNPAGTPDAIAGEPGALAEAGAYPTAGITSVALWTSDTAGSPVLTAEDIAVDAAGGGFAEVALSGTELAAPGALWISATDAMGNQSARVALTRGVPADGPLPDAQVIEIVRAPVGATDAVSFPAGAFASTCAVVRVEVFGDAAGTAPLGAADATSASLPAIPIGTETSSSARAWIVATDKCGGSSGAPFEVTRGRDLDGPGVALTLAEVRRVAEGEVDAVQMPAGTFFGTCAPATARVFEAPTGGTPIASRAIAADGSAPEVPVGTTTAAPPHLYLEVESKCGASTPARILIARGDSQGVTSNPLVIAIERLPIGAPDRVSGGATAFSSSCALTALEVLRPDTQAQVGSAALDPVDGAFPATPFGTSTQSFPTVHLRANDKCGEQVVTVPGSGEDNEPPILEPFTAVATIGHAGEPVTITSTGPIFQDGPASRNDAVIVYAEDDPATAQSAAVAAAADGSIGPLTLTPERAPQWIRLVATDKSGNSASALVPQLNGRWTFDGRTRWNHAPGPELIAFPFTTRATGFENTPGAGPVLAAEADSAHYASLAQADGLFLAQAAVAEDATRTAGWQALTPGTSPTALHNFAMARDLTTADVFLAGGRGPACCGGQGPVLDEVLRGPGSTGTETWSSAGSFGASPRELLSMAFDSWRSRLVLFGGTDGEIPPGEAFPAFFNDTLEFAAGGDAPGWSVRTEVAPTAPSPRGRTAMAFDAARGRMVLFGGFLATGVTDDETWEYDGQRWTRMAPAGPTPLARCGHSMAYDAARNVVVMTGGSSGGDQTWEYAWDPIIRNTRWTLRESGSHAQVEDAAMVYDARRQKVMLTGGKDEFGDPVSASLDWDEAGGAWVASPGAAPSARFEHAMAFEPDLSRSVLYGGVGSDRDTLIYEDVSPHQRIPALSAVLRLDPATVGNALTVTWIGWGAGDQAGGTRAHGVTLHLYHHGTRSWTPLAQHFFDGTADQTQQTLTATVPAQDVPSYLQGGVLWVLASPMFSSSPSGGAGIASELHTDFLEVSLGYSPF